MASRRRRLLLLGGATGEVLGRVRLRGVNDGLLHTHVLGIDHARLVSHAVTVTRRSVNLLGGLLVHHGSGGISGAGVDLTRHAIRSGGHVGHGVILHLRLVDGSGNRADVVFLGVVPGDNVDEEVEDVGLLNGGRNVRALEGAALGLLGLGPGAVSKF